MEIAEFYDSELEYTITIDAPGVTVGDDQQKETVVVETEKIKLHFLRYGLLRKNKFNEELAQIKSPSQGGLIFPEKDPEHSDNYNISQFIIDDVEIKNAVNPDKTEQFHRVRTFLDVGYIYIINETDGLKYFEEYKVEEDGKLYQVVWKHAKTAPNKRKLIRDYPDIRLETNITVSPVGTIEVSRDALIWIAYSNVQWTVDYCHKIFHDDSEKFKRMIVLECSGFQEEQNYINAIPINEVVVYNIHEESSGYIQSFYKELKRVEDNFPITRGDQIESMFITLDAPINCAEDIHQELLLEHARLEATVESIETGRDEDEIMAKILDGTYERGELVGDEPKLNALYLTALGLYNLVYDNAEMIEKFDGKTYHDNDDGLYKTKIINVLGVTYRKKQREVISLIRDNFGEWLKTDYYQARWKEYEENLEYNTLDGQLILSGHLASLAKIPQDFDKKLDLRSTWEDPKDDKWRFLILETMEENPNKCINSLLNRELNFYNLIAYETLGLILDLSNKFAGVVRNTVETYARQINLVQEVTRDVEIQKYAKDYRRFTINRANTFGKPHVDLGKNADIFTEDYFFYRTTPYTLRLHVIDILKECKKHGVEFDWGAIEMQGSVFNPDSGNGMIAFKVDNTTTDLKLLTSGSPIEPDIIRAPVKVPTTTVVIKKPETIKTNFLLGERNSIFPIDPNSEFTEEFLNQRSASIFNSVEFMGALSLLQFVNALYSLRAFSEKKDVKNLVNSIGITAELAEAIGYTLRAKKNNMGVKAVNLESSFLMNGTRFAGAVGAFVTVGICFWEAYDRLDANDTDAAVAATVSGISWAFLYFFGAYLGPLGLLCVVVVGLGAHGLSYWLTDSPLETFTKKCVFSKAVLLEDLETISNLKPHGYAQLMLKNRDELVEEDAWFRDGYKKWEDFEYAYKEFMDIILCGDMKAPIVDEDLFTSSYYDPSHLGFAWFRYESVNFRVKVFLLQFLQDPNKIECKVYYFSKGINKPKHRTELMDIDLRKSIIQGDSNTGPHAIIDFSLYGLTGINYKRGEIVFTCRIKVKDKYYPFSLKGERAMAIRIKPHGKAKLDLISGKLTHFESEYKLDTIERIKSGEAW